MDKGNDCLISVDGTDFQVPENGRTFYSHKFKKSGVRYELGVCILTGDCVWVHGPFECGNWPNINIFNNSLKHHLAENERVKADDGYIGGAPLYIKCPASFGNEQECLHAQQRVRNRQETLNKCFKDLGILRQVYRHKLEDHGDVVRAVLVLTQIAINQGEKLFTCGYRTPNYD